MGSPYRSEQMQLCQLIAHKDAAFACIAQLGKRGCVQFKDEKRITFERVLWRACRWTAFVRDAEIEDVIQDPLTLLSALAKRLPLWQNQVYQQKAIYHTLNMCTYDPSGVFLIMECWMPKSHHKNVQEALDKAVVCVALFVKERAAKKSS
ncbi:V-type proton ATPase subunit a isoform [Toxocara canis]|uniref:V-type proton ATPase subunit a n=1 Tax=Toxocara canis TaxID=6265 RepID=A0A0B2W1L8_TOXCA|nr:V-type proton ATPase subunit a isoform [Toxocara canis]